MKKKKKNFNVSLNNGSHASQISRYRGFGRIWSSKKSPPDSGVSREPTEGDGPKTSEFKFCKNLQEDVGHSYHSSLPNEQDNHLKNLEGSKSVAGDGLKISEFKFHKKLQEDAGHSCHSSLPNEQDSHLKNLEPSKNICRKKRVRFADCDAAHETSFKPNASSMLNKRTFSPICDGPKTSEFKFYKKLQEDAGNSYHSSLPNEQGNHLKNFEPSKSTAGDGLKIPEFKFHKKLQEDAGHSYHSSLLTEQDNHLSNLEPSKSMAEFQYKHGEIFSRKRHKLLQIASEALSCGVYMSSSKGSDMVSEFLQRLGIESHTGVISTSREMKSSIKSQLVASPESDVHFIELPRTRTPRMNFMASTTGNDMVMHLPKCWYNEVDDRFLLPWNNPGSYSISTQRPHKTGSWYERSHSDCVMDDGRATGLRANRSMDFGIDRDTEFSFNRYGFLTSDHMLSELDVQKTVPACWGSLGKSPVPIYDSSLREMDNTYSPNDPGLKSGKGSLQLLGWYDDSTKNDPDLSMALESGAEPTFFEDEDHCWNIDSKFDANALWSPSNPTTHYSSNFTSSQTFHLDRWPVSTFGRYNHEERDYPVAESDHFLFTFYPTQNHFTLTEDNEISDSHEGIELVLAVTS